jgi:hypothetical protein
MTKVAKKPPTLANPLADPKLCLGTKSLEKSKATIDAGPPMDMTRKQISNNHEGDFSGIANKTTQAKTVSHTTE